MAIRITFLNFVFAGILVLTCLCTFGSTNDNKRYSSTSLPDTSGFFPRNLQYQISIAKSNQANGSDIKSDSGNEHSIVFKAREGVLRIWSELSANEVDIFLHDTSKNSLEEINISKSSSTCLDVLVDDLKCGRNYKIILKNRSTSNLDFLLNVQWFPIPVMESSTNTYEYCSAMRPKFFGGTYYCYSVAPVENSEGRIYSLTTEGALYIDSPALNLRHRKIYDLWLEVGYTVSNSNGIVDTIVVRMHRPYRFEVSSHSLVQLKKSQKLPATVGYGSGFGSKDTVCSAINYSVEITEIQSNTDTSTIGGPRIFTNDEPIPFFNNCDLNGVLRQKYYKVRFRPNFGYGPGGFGPADYIYIASNVEYEGCGDWNQCLFKPSEWDMPKLSFTRSAHVLMDDYFKTCGHLTLQLFEMNGRMILNEKIVRSEDRWVEVPELIDIESGLYRVQYIAQNWLVTDYIFIP